MKKTPQELEQLIMRKKWQRAWRLLLRWSIRFIAIFLLLFLVLYVLVQTSWFQDKATQTAASFLSKELQTKVEVERLDIDFFDKLVLENFYVEDTNQDTLIYAKRLSANFNTNIIALVQRSLDISSLTIEDAEVNLKRDSGQVVNNLNLLLNKMVTKGDSTSTEAKEGKPFFLDVDALYLHNVRFEREDIPWGKYLLFDVEEGSIQVNNLDLQNNLIDIKSAHFINPFVQGEERLRDEEKMEAEWAQWDEYKAQQAEVAATAEPDTTYKPFLIKVEKFRLDDGQFVFHNFRRSLTKTGPLTEMDFNHLHVHDIQLDVDDFSFTEKEFKGEVKKAELIEESGFKIDHLSSKEVTVNPRRVELFGVDLKTPNSTMGDTLIFKYREYMDFHSFPTNVMMDLKFNESEVALKDIMVFAKALENNPFFAQNRDEILSLSGDFKGRVTSLRGEDLKVKIGNSTEMVGEFRSRDLTDKNEAYLTFIMDSFHSDIQTLKLLIPNFKPPPNFDRLGQLDFKGRFDGFLVDFVADGDLTTDLGRATMDMRLDLKGGRERAEYSGNLSLIDFDLGRWTGDPNVGTISFASKVQDGIGLTLETVDAKLSANVEHFLFRGYDYKNVSINGNLNKSLFDGDLVIKDDNIDFTFAGSIEIKDSIPFYDFEAEINHLNMKALNLIEEDFTLSGNVDLKLNGRNISDIQGLATVQDFELVRGDTSKYQMDSLWASSKIDPLGRKSLDIHSEIFDLNVNGEFDLNQITNAVVLYLEKNYSVFAERLNIKSKVDSVSTHRFNFNLNLIDSKNFHELIDSKLDTLRNVVADGMLDNVEDSLFLDVKLLELGYDNLDFDDLVLIVNGNKDQSYIDFGSFHTVLNNVTHFAPIYFISYINNDTINFNINATNFTKVLDNINLNGKFYFLEDYMQISFLPSNLVLLNEDWDIDANNYVRFREDYIETKNFKLTNGDRIINLESVGDKGLSFNLKNLDIDFVNDLWTYEPLQFAGNIEVEAKTDDIFNLENLTGDITLDTFWVNGDDWGKFRAHGNMANLKTPVNSWLTITRGNRELVAKGFYVPATQESRKPRASFPPNYFAYSIDIDNYPLNIAEYFIGHSVSNTVGTIGASLTLKGTPKKPVLRGKAEVEDGAITIDYLGTRYFIDKQTANINEKIFDATGAIITDSLGNQAYVTGGIIHDHFKNLGLDAGLSTPKFIALDTKKGDNEIYYGYGIGQGDVRFTGSFKQTNIKVNAVTGTGTQLFLPIDYGATSSNREFITFLDPEEQNEEDGGNKSTLLRGINLDMNLEVTDAAEVQLIFDESQGNIIRGRGNGNIQLIIDRRGDLNMYGDYIISSGDYLFTFPQLAVSKPFEVSEGGIIRWDGDPFDARIDIKARYDRLFASLQPFIGEIPGIDQGEVQNSKTRVDLIMLLDGALLRPNINFEIAFPSLSGKFRGVVDRYLQVLKQDQNEMNRQVFGLLVLGTFLPNNENTVTANSLSTALVNTVSEMLSNQLSSLVTEMFASYIDEDGVLSGFDIQLGYDTYSDLGQSDFDIGSILSDGWEVQVKPRIYLWNNRISFSPGLVSGQNTAAQGNSYVRPDLLLEARLTQDGRWRLFAYNRPDIDISRDAHKTGVGLRYQTEFDSFKELFNRKKEQPEIQVEEIGTFPPAAPKPNVPPVSTDSSGN